MDTLNLAIEELGPAPMPDQILIIEDEAAIADTLLYALRTEGFEVSWQSLGSDGLRHLEDEVVDLVILDVGLPDENGFELCKRIRSISEIATRVKAILRRARARPPQAGCAANDAQLGTADVTDFSLDDERKRITFLGQVLDLTRYEFFLLRTLLGQPERIFSRAQLMDQIWDEPEASYERAVDTHIKSLRAKLRAVNATRNPIRTHRGLGYSLQPGG